jgi:PAS domain S-box-containing protein
MLWNYAYTQTVWLPLIAVLFLLGLSIYSWHYRGVAGAVPLTAGGIFAALWVAGYAMEILAVDQVTKIFWFNFQAIWILPASNTVTCFILEYTWPGRWLSRRVLIGLFAIGLLRTALILTNDLHHLMWLSYSYNGSIYALRGLAAWFFTGYLYLLAIPELLAFLWLFRHSSMHRWPVTIMLIGVVLGRSMFVIDAYMINTSLPLDMLTSPVVFLTFAVAVFVFRVLDPIPAARQTALAQMPAGMVVLDSQGCIVSLNPAAERIFDADSKNLRGKPVCEILPDISDEILSRPGEIEIEIKLENEPEPHFYGLSISLLKDWRNQAAGRLLLLHDLTRRRQAELALHETREIQRLIFENAVEGIAIYEEYPDLSNRKLLECNERYVEMAGRSKQELLEIADPTSIQTPLPPVVPYSKPRRANWDAQSEGFFSWVRPDGKTNIVEYNAASIQMDGRLLTIGLDRDVTERTQAQAQIIEQQRALAMLKERENLARELHDSTSQILGYAGFQLEAIHDRIRAGQDYIFAGQPGMVEMENGARNFNEASEMLSRMGNILEEAHADLREYILNLRLAPSEQRPFFATLRHYLDGYSQNYNILAGLSIAPGIDDDTFDPGAQMQLFRIIQEALSNARKHAAAKRVEISFKINGRQVQIQIQDNGRGFTPSQVDSSPSALAQKAHFGLRFMLERAEQMGGSLDVRSAPGEGTCVSVLVPV